MNETAPFSPVALVGTIALLAAYIVAAWCVGAGIAGNAMKSRKLVSSVVYGMYGFGALIGLASALMIYAFLTHDFSIKYVASTSDVSMDTAYKITAFWGGLDGSLLYWVLVLAIFSMVAIAVNHRRHRDMMGYVVATIMCVQVFFLSLLIFTKNPFATFLTTPPADGQGLNPLLQNYWMIIHPPMLYTGFVAATVPFAFCIGALASGRLDDLWLGSVRVWMLICFGCLSVGLILGGRWAYEELGWGGYWAWDPVENAGFIPWFTATAFLHSAIIQEQRGGMKVWNCMLVILTFFLTIFGTFMTRSGAVQSVHAFGEDNVLALQFIVFMAVILVVSIGLVIYRAPKLSARTNFESFLSREFAFLVNNWILLLCAFFVLFFTMFPTISEALDGSRVSIGIEFFDRWMTFAGIVLLFLGGAAPLLAWRKTSGEKLLQQFMIPLGAMALTIIVLLIFFPQTTHRSALFHPSLRLPMSLVNFGVCAFALTSILQEFWRGVSVRRKQSGSDPLTAFFGLIAAKHRKYGGYVVHLGVVVMFVGFGGKAYDRQIDKTVQRPAIDLGLADNKTDAERAGWALRYLDLTEDTTNILRCSFPAVVPEDMKAEQVDCSKYPRVDRASAKALCPESGCTMKALPDMRPCKSENEVDQRQCSGFEFGDYTFLYERIMHSSDEHKSSVTAQVSIWHHHKDHIGVVYPAKWDFRKGSEATTEVAIRVRPTEDVYVVLTGYELESQLGNFRVYINPLITWVWIGTILVGIGTMLCIIMGFVHRVISGRPGRTGQVGKLAMVALLAGGIIAAPSAAHAQAEHVAAGGGMGDSGVGYPSMNRPDTDAGKRSMQELRCMCNCPTESIFACKCGWAAKLRGQINELIHAKDAKGNAKYNLGTDEGQAKAYDDVLAWYVGKYGSGALLNPQSSAAWLLPALAIVGGLGLLLVVGRRFIGRGRAVAVASAPTATAVEDDEYADKLDDELAKTE
jgi:cytochrome c-type biogenesis protein CcmF